MKKYLFSVAQIVQLFASAATLFIFESKASAASLAVEEYEITAKKLNASRNKLSPSIGASTFSFTKEDIDNLPQGQATSLNQVLLRAPGVAQDSYGQIHVRNDHGNLQYRINGIMLPEGIGGFGQTLDTHFAESISLMTGALPAQYGYRTAGVVDIKTKSGALKNGGRSEVMIGGYDTTQLSQEVSGSAGNLNYYINGTYLQNSRGVESATKDRAALHNDTRQDKVFGYFSYLLDAQTKASLIVANADNNFQIPNNPNQAPVFTLNNAGNVSSSSLNQKQSESNTYAIAALQGVSNLEIDYQFAAFVRRSNVKYRGDDVGDLVFNGVASDIDKTSSVTGLQADFSYDLNSKNTLRSGFMLTNELVKSYNSNAVFLVDDDGNQTGFDAVRINEKGSKRSHAYGFYLQNEWKALKKLTINYGARFDVSRSYVNANQLSPRLGAIYNLSENTKFHAGYSRYFTTAPNELVSTSTLSLYQNTTNASNSQINDPVRPERTNYYDIGVLHKLTSHINIGLDGYYKDIRNVLDEGQFGQSLISTPFNYAQGKAYGVEFTGDYKKDNFSSYINLSWQEVRAKKVISGQHLLEDDELNYVNNHYVKLDHDQQVTASAGLTYIWKQTKFSGDAIFGNGLRKGFVNKERQASYAQLNGAVSRDFILPIIEKFNLRFLVINLLDRNYQIHDGSGIGVRAPQYALRRTGYIIFSKSF